LNLENKNIKTFIFTWPIENVKFILEDKWLKERFITFDYNGNDTFQVSSLGDGYFNSENYVVNIIDVGYLGSTFNNGTTGTSKRVILTMRSLIFRSSRIRY
jgi:hypothetical protein